MFLEFKFNGLPPVPAARTRSTKHGHHFTPKRYAEYKAALASAIRAEFPELGLTIPPPGTRERSKYLRDNRLGILLLIYRTENRGDHDNYLKSVQDALEQSGIIANDSQIDWGFQAKLIDKYNPRVEFVVMKTPGLLTSFVVKVYNFLKSIGKTKKGMESW